MKHLSKYNKVKAKGPDVISPTSTDFIFGTKVHSDKAYSMIQVSMVITEGQIFQKKKKRIKTKQLAAWMLFHPQTSSHLLSQIFVTHLGVALLF